MQARAGAIDELIASGALDDASSINRGDDISRELEAMSSESEVENELARLRAKANPQAIEAADDSRRHPPGRVREEDDRRRQLMIVRILGEGSTTSPTRPSGLNDSTRRSSAVEAATGSFRALDGAARRRPHGRVAAPDTWTSPT
jgi:hypothetical protein